MLRIGCLVFVLIPMLILALASIFRKRESEPTRPETIGSAKEISVQGSNSPKRNDPEIPGLMPVDVYLGLEKEGFRTTKELNPCCTWYSSLGGNSTIIMTAQAHGRNASSLYRINARVVTTVDKNTKAIAEPFFGYLATLQYSGAQPEVAREWVVSNTGKRGSKQFGPAVISLDVGSDNALMMSITPAD